MSCAAAGKPRATLGAPAAGAGSRRPPSRRAGADAPRLASARASRPTPRANPRRLASAPRPDARDHRLEALARERQHAARRDRAEHHGADHGAGLARRAPPCRTRRARGCAGARRRAAASESKRPSPSGIFSAVVSVRLSRGDRPASAPALDHAALHDARRLRAARRRPRDRCSRAPAAGSNTGCRPPSAAIGSGIDLDVIGGGAGALRDAGDRRALRRDSPACVADVDQPLGEHAAAFAAERARSGS